MTPAPAPSSRPLALVESGQRLTHHLRLVDESTPTRRARPRGVLGNEVWVRLDEPNSQVANGQSAKSEGSNTGMAGAARALGDPSTFSFLTMTTRSSFRAEFKAGEGGKTAVYMARWVNTWGARRKGPWPEVTPATAAA